MNPSEGKLEENNPLDTEIIEFIMQHIHDETLLTDYFSKLTVPLSASILTMRLSANHDQSLGTEEYNFLAY